MGTDLALKLRENNFANTSAQIFNLHDYRVFQRASQEDPVVQNLLNNIMPAETARFARQLFRVWFFEQRLDPAALAHLKKYYYENSTIGHAIIENPGCGEAFYYLYNHDVMHDYRTGKPLSKVDTEYWRMCGAAIQMHERLNCMIGVISGVSKKYFSEHEKITIDNLCSGQGYDAIGALYANPDIARRCSVRNIDTDEIALEQGWQRAVQYGLEDIVENINKDIRKVRTRGADILIESGIICPLPPAEAHKTVNFFNRKYGRKGTIVIINATMWSMYEGSPFDDSHMRTGSWHMDYKIRDEKVDEFNDILHACNMEVLETHYDSKGYNCIKVARIM